MTFSMVWGERAGFAGTGTVQSVLGLIDFLTNDTSGLEYVSLSANSIVFRGIYNSQTVTISVDGSGFRLNQEGFPEEVGVISGFSYFAGASVVATQLIGTIGLNVGVSEFTTIVNNDNDGIDRSAVETYFTSDDWVFEGTRFTDDFPEGLQSPDGITMNLMGNDSIDLAGGNDLFFAGDGNDTVSGGNGFDTIGGGAGDDVITGDDGADSLSGDDGNDSISGGLGFDQIFGNDGDDTLDGGDTPDRVFGGNGNDLIMGGTNFSLTVDGLFGEAGNDTIYGQAGFDLLDGGDGDDLLDGGHQADNLLGGNGNDTMYGGLGLDRLFGGNDDDLGYGGVGTDGMFGEFGNDTLYGEDGNDRFFGGSGNDSIFGGADDDTVFAGSGFDTIDGGTGNDLLQGNFNADTFVFADGHGNDTITDFTLSGTIERIDLSAVTAITDFQDLLDNHTDQISNSTLVINTGGGNTIQLNNVQEFLLQENDFIF